MDVDKYDRVTSVLHLSEQYTLENPIIHYNVSSTNIMNMISRNASFGGKCGNARRESTKQFHTAEHSVQQQLKKMLHLNKFIMDEVNAQSNILQQDTDCRILHKTESKYQIIAVIMPVIQEKMMKYKQ